MKKKNGFTLVEVIVVLLILAVLAAIAIPALTGYVNDTRKSAHIPVARAINQEVELLINKELVLNPNDFENLKVTWNRKFSHGQYNEINKLITTEVAEGYYIYSIDLEFDGLHNESGWNHNPALNTHKISKYCITLSKKGVQGLSEESIFLVTIPNDQVYVYNATEGIKIIGSEKGPVFNL